jgi:hypothetical protein
MTGSAVSPESMTTVRDGAANIGSMDSGFAQKARPGMTGAFLSGQCSG